MEISMEIPHQKLKPELPYDPAIPFLSVHLQKCKGGTCTSMFIAARFTKGKLWNTPRRPLTDGGLRICAMGIPRWQLEGGSRKRAS
jgi:hypothetical protein